MDGKKQSSILSFFSQSSKVHVKSSTDSDITSLEATSNAGKSSNTYWNGNTEKASEIFRDENSRNDKRVIRDDDDLNSLFKAKSKRKRRRVICSSASESDIGENMQINDVQEDCTTDERPKSKVGTRKGLAEESISDATQSFIASFRAMAGDDLNTSRSTLDRTMYQVETDEHDLKRHSECNNSMFSECSPGQFPHLGFDFLQPHKIRDADLRPFDHPEYSPRTLYIPESFLKQQTPGHRQWWAIKSIYFDTVLFFKVGKFYEMYHMDAVIGVENLNLTHMRGKIAHCGFPEIAYGRFADQLVSRGYKVTRVEQTETPSQLEERNRAEKCRDKVVKREVCAVTTIGTRTFGVLNTNDEENAIGSVEYSARYLLAFSEKIECSSNGTIVSFGVCFIDTSVGKFYLSQFEDDCNRSSFRTLLAHHQPSQILYERGCLSNATSNLLQNVAVAIAKEALIPKKEFPTAESTIEKLLNKVYLGNVARNWPDPVKNMLLDANAILPKCLMQYSECMKSMGSIIWYLERCLICVDMISMRNFHTYAPPTYKFYNQTDNGVDYEKPNWLDRHLILDGISLFNLNIVPRIGESKNKSQDSISSKFSLYNVVCKCITPFGKRLFRQWICSPSCDPIVIKERQDAVQWLLDAEAKSFVAESTGHLRKIPDIERLLQKIHTLGLKYRASEHADGRAVMFEANRYNRRKVNELLLMLSGLEHAVKLVNKYRNSSISGKPSLLQRCIGDCFPDISPDLIHFANAFDHEKARRDGVIVPERGVVKEFDAAIRDIDGYISELNTYLKKLQEDLKCKSISYTGSGKLRYQIEIPEKIANDLGPDFELKSSRKGFKRMATCESEKLFNNLLRVEERRDSVQSDALRRIFADFDNRSQKWMTVIERIALFDVLLSLARYAETSGLTLCRPQISDDLDKPSLEIVSGYHPCLANRAQFTSDSGRTYIPNDTQLGGEAPSSILLTGPNMGGKSTLMRQVAVLVVLAQMGSFVPAKNMRLTPIDRIFTRIGANDRIASGHSTFHVELSETNVILRNATRHSLVIMDELGRGTSTHDGASIACAVLMDLAVRIRCRCFFSTHYHNLCSAVQHVNNIKSAHMACVTENENESDPTLENVTFLYRLSSGVCSKSHGFYAAKVSGIKSEVIRSAFLSSRKIDSSIMRRKFSLFALRSAALNGCDTEALRQLVVDL